MIFACGAHGWRSAQVRCPLCDLLEGYAYQQAHPPRDLVATGNAFLAFLKKRKPNG